MGELTPSTLRSHLVQRLREDILSGKYKPRDRVNESSIAREFGISRIPVREALFELRESGLVMSHERRGMFVTFLSEEDVQKISSVRMILEAEALTLARAHMTPVIAAALVSLVDRMESTTSTLAEAAALDLEFHRTIWAAAGNEYLVKVLDPLATVLFAQYTLERVSSEHRRWRLNHHRALLDVILGPKERDSKAAFLMHMQATYTEGDGPRIPPNQEADFPAKLRSKRPSPRQPKKRPPSKNSKKDLGVGTVNKRRS
jgi:DNA-binding GntR family transcriptional regulator